MIPVLPLYLRERDFGYTLVTVIVAAAGVGALLANLPIGTALGRRSERTVMVAAVIVVAGSTLGLALGGPVPVLGLLRIASGAGMAGWLLARQTWVARRLEPRIRGRALAVFGGVARVAMLIGPLVGGVMADRFGFQVTFLAAGLISALGLIPLLTAADLDVPQSERPRADALGVLTVARRHLRVLLKTGSAQVLTVTVRRGRLVLIPLLGAALGLTPSRVGVLIAIGMATDLALTPVAGWLMDSYGRLVAIVPAFTLLGIGLLIVPFTSTFGGLVGASLVMGFGNGLGSGTMLTLSTDVAPAGATGQFLGALGVMKDSGRIFGPLLVGALGDLVGLNASAVALGLLSLLAAVVFARLIGETLSPATTPHTSSRRFRSGPSR